MLYDYSDNETILATIAGAWRNDVSDAEYQDLMAGGYMARHVLCGADRPLFAR